MTKRNRDVTVCNMRLIEVLGQIQSGNQLTDQQFAARLGIHRVSWSRIKNGRVGMSQSFLKKILMAYPELKPNIDIFLFGDVTKGTTKMIKQHKTPLIAPFNEAQGALKTFCVGLLSRIRK